MQSSHLKRTRNIIHTAHANHIQIDDKQYIDFSSNDYLGLKNHPSIIHAAIHGIQQYAQGSHGSAFISGYTKAHERLEQAFADWLEVDKAILFTSGYTANLGVLSALCNKKTTLFADKLSHASLIDGMRLSRAKYHRYRHNDLRHIEQLAQKKPPNCIVTESVFSMEGALTPIPEIIKLSQRYHAGLIIDDAHGIGVLGNHGRGIIAHYKLSQVDFSCLVTPLGKAFHSIGAIVAGRADIIEQILQSARTYCYTTALPGAICESIHETLHTIQKETWRQEKLLENIKTFTTYAQKKKLTLTSEDKTPIKPILIYSTEKAIALQAFLKQAGFFVPAIRPPTVPKQTARLRISLNSLHTHTQIIALIDAIERGLTACKYT